MYTGITRLVSTVPLFTSGIMAVSLGSVQIWSGNHRKELDN